MFRTHSVAVIFILGIASQCHSTTFVGEIRLTDGWHYCKLNNDSTWIAELPYLFMDTTFSIEGDPLLGDWRFIFPFSEVDFNTTSANDEKILATCTVSGQQHRTKFYAQRQITDEQELDYVGHYADAKGEKIQVYRNYDYLHIHSPYSQRIMSLKNIGPREFFTVSGEIFRFSDHQQGSYRTLTMVNRERNQRILQRLGTQSVQQQWLMVEGDSVHCQVHIPPGDGPHPGILLFSGAKLPMAQAKMEAELFTSAGLVVFLFNKPGVGRTISKDHQDFQTWSFNDKTEYYANVLRECRKHPRVQGQSLGVHGGSEEGRLAVMLAAKYPNIIAFVIGVSVPVQTYMETRSYAIDHIMRLRGFSEEQILRTLTVWREYLDHVSEGKIPDELVLRVKKLHDEGSPLYLPPPTADLPPRPKPSDVENDLYDHLSKVKCPVFFQYGETDNVVNFIHSIRNIHDLNNAGKFTVKQYRRGDHSLMTPEQEICHGILDDKMYWLKDVGIIPR